MDLRFLKSHCSAVNRYKNWHWWDDRTVDFLTSYKLYQYMFPMCGLFLNAGAEYLLLDNCYFEEIQNFYTLNRLNYLCEIATDADKTSVKTSAEVSPIEISQFLSLHYVACPKRHFVHPFLACDVHSSCFANGEVNYDSSKDAWDTPSRTSCPAPFTSLPPSFACDSGVERVPYSLVCDHRQDCQDNSDEDFCVFPPCSRGELQCGRSKQCYPIHASCDEHRDCAGGEDEELCAVTTAFLESPLPINPPLIVETDGRGAFSFKSLSNIDIVNGSVGCPHTHFQCPGQEMCLPVYMRCNGVFDCPYHEDEVACGTYTCPGFYHCRISQVCVHPDNVCDGVHHCPLFDDELFCNFTCPDVCKCYGLAFSCNDLFLADDYPQIRYLSARGSEFSTHHLTNNTMLIHLNLAKCNLVDMPDVDFPNLHSLDLSDNDIDIAHSSQLSHLPRLRALFLSNNPLTSVFLLDVLSSSSTDSINLHSENYSTDTIFSVEGKQYITPTFAHSAYPVVSPSPNIVTFFPKLRRLDVSLVKAPELNIDVFKQFPNLQNLNLSGSGLERVLGDNTHPLTELRVLDLRGCPMSALPRRLLRGLGQLHTLYADNYKLCCPAILPEGFNLNNCLAPFDEISSCETLLRSDVYRVFLSIIASLTLTGNLGSFIFRLLASHNGKAGFHIFTVHLCVADFVMGLYLAIIGVADRLYLGTYLWEDTMWRQSAACKVAGFFSLLSSETSVFLICLITLDRFLVLRFPFSSLRFQSRSAHVACIVTWSISFILAAVPLFPWTPYKQFYSSTGICIPLPITRKEFDGSDYAFGIMIIFNFALFLLIAMGQAVIYQTVRANSMTTTFTSRQSQDSNIARRLITVVMTDFLCWFPIGLLGMLASRGTPIAGEVNVGMAIFVLPLNSVINPFLYTINIIMEKRQKSKEDRILKWLESS